MADMALGRGTTRAGAGAEFRLAGEVARSGPLTVAALRAFPARSVRVEIACSCGGPRRYAFSGPLLYDVIMAAAPAFDPHAKDRVRYLVSVTGADGHRATLSWGELDPGYGDTGALLATEVDGKGLDGDGPQLAVPHDKGGSRYVSQVTEIWVGPPPVRRA